MKYISTEFLNLRYSINLYGTKQHFICDIQHLTVENNVVGSILYMLSREVDWDIHNEFFR